MKMRVIKSVLLLLLCVSVVFFVWCVSGNELAHVSAKESIRLCAIMYHQISKDGKNTGKYVIAADELEKDLKYINEKGYKTVNVQDLTDYVDGKITLPEKCVMLTFDDGFETHYTVVYPLLKKYGMKGVVSVIGSLTELYTENGDHNDLYSYLDEEEIKLLSSSDEIEIQNHSFDMHYSKAGKRKGINKLNNETYEEYEAALTNDVGKQQRELLRITGRLPLAMVYPFGECCDDTVKICKKLGFRATFTCEEKVNTVTAYRKESLYNIGRFNRSGIVGRGEFFKKVLSDL